MSAALVPGGNLHRHNGGGRVRRFNRKRPSEFIEPPVDNEPRGIAIALFLVFCFVIAHFWGGGTLAIPYLACVVIGVLICLVLLPRGLHLGWARLLAVLIGLGLSTLVFISGFPLMIADLLSPIAQHQQNHGGNFGASVNMTWLVVVAILSLGGMAYSFWVLTHGKRALRIVLTGFLFGLATLPLLGVIAQALVVDMPS